jgi:uncharacterized RDD family membrane protein YckC
MYCSHCGVQIADGSQFCPACGQSTSIARAGAAVAEVAVSAPVAAPGGFGGTFSPGIPEPRIGYAGFWLRLVALIIDGLIIDVVLGIPFFMFLGGAGILRAIMAGNPPEDMVGQFVGVVVLFALAASVAIWFYYALFESSPWQATPGKRALGLYVTDIVGQRISFARASGRFFAKIISRLTLMIGFLMAGFTERKQALHDMIAGTLVLRKL